MSRHVATTPQSVAVILLCILLPAALSLSRIPLPPPAPVWTDGSAEQGYTYSLLLFVVPLAAIVVWLIRTPGQQIPLRATAITLMLLIPLGFVLDFAFGLTFFTFPNEAATVGLYLPGWDWRTMAWERALPIEEFVFYSAGFAFCLLAYLLCDVALPWARPERDPFAVRLGRFRMPELHFHARSVLIAAVVLAAGVAWKKLASDSPDGFPGYLAFLLCVGFVPPAGLFRSVQSMVNWPAYLVATSAMASISLLWEATLALPWGFWGFDPYWMTGLFIPAWWNLPIEEPFLWFLVSYATVIVFEAARVVVGQRAARTQ